MFNKYQVKRGNPLHQKKKMKKVKLILIQEHSACIQIVVYLHCYNLLF